MAVGSGFPPDLLSKPKAARMAYFTGLTIAHPLLAQAYERVRRAVSEASSDSLIFVFGPSGVGKTTMMRRFERHLIEEMSQELTADRGQIPVVSVEAVAPDSGGFNWKDFYKRLLVGLEEPLVDRKIKPDNQDEPRPRHQRPMICRTVAIAEWRMAVERALHYRRPRAILIDEAQHMAKISALDEAIPPSVKELSRRLGYTQGTLYEHFPEECAELSARRSRYLEEEKTKRKQQRREEIRRSIIELHNQGTYPSLRRVGKRLSKPSAMSGSFDLEVFREVMSELGIQMTRK